MAAMDEAALAEVFGKEGAPVEEMPPEGTMVDEDEGEALDMAIDELFSAEDPEARREAFKRAVELCGSHGGY